MVTDMVSPRRKTCQARVAIVGGGVAGLAAAAALASCGVSVDLFERRSRLGGRAGSYFDTVSGEWIDHCQHVNLGCCTNYADFCRRTGTRELFRRHSTLHFIGPDARQYDLSRSPGLPAPVHLAPSLLRMRYLTIGQRWGIIRALWQLAFARECKERSIGAWLRSRRQSAQAIALFWSPVLVSALSESLDNIAAAAARKVFVDAFLASASGYVMEVPSAALQHLYAQTAGWLSRHGVRIRLQCPIQEVVFAGTRVVGVQPRQGPPLEYDAVIVAVPWRQLPEVLGTGTAVAVPDARLFRDLPSTPISSVHLWFDRPAIPLEHAILLDRVSQWVFCRPSGTEGEPGDFHCQIVISNSRSLAERAPAETVQLVLADLRNVWPAVNMAELRRWRVITAQEAILSPRAQVEALRPPQETAIPNLFLAGDWTQTGWPGTMEGGVRSGYRAAELALQQRGEQVRFVQPEPRTWLTHLLFPRDGSAGGVRPSHSEGGPDV